MAQTTFETFLMVDDYLERFGPEDCFEECRKDERQAMDDFKAECRDLLSPSAYAQLEFGNISFVEFDSGNPTHAAGYFNVEVTGPKRILERLAKKREG